MRTLLDASVERLFADLATPAALLACEDSAWPHAMWAAVEASGVALALTPEARGGAGASWADVCGVVRLAGRFGLPLPLPETLLANWVLGAAGLDPVDGAATIGLGAGLRLHEGRVTGRLDDVAWGGVLTRVVAVAGGRVLLLDVGTAQITASANIAAEPRATLVFDAARPLAQAELPAGWPADVLLLGGAMLRAAQIAGAMEAVLAMSVEYSAQRIQFGKPIASFQAIAHQLAQLAEQTASTVMAAEAAFAASGTRIARLPAIVAKICASESAGLGASVAHAVHGAIGFTHEHTLHLVTRRLWSWRSEFGSAASWSQRLGRAVCAAGPEQFWPAITGGAFATLEDTRP